MVNLSFAATRTAVATVATPGATGARTCARAVVVVTIGVRGLTLNIGKPQNSRMM